MNSYFDHELDRWIPARSNWLAHLEEYDRILNRETFWDRAEDARDPKDENVKIVLAPMLNQ